MNIIWNPTELLDCARGAEHLLLVVVSVLSNFSVALFVASILSLWITSSDAILISVLGKKGSCAAELPGDPEWCREGVSRVLPAQEDSMRSGGSPRKRTGLRE